MRARRWSLWLIALPLLLGLSSPPPAAAQTIDEIIKRGKVIVGVNTTTPIFGLIGADGHPEGYDPDVARLVGKYLGVPVEFVSVTGANRIPNLLSGKVDMLICLFGITPERALQVWYSIPYASEAATLVAPESRKVKSVDDLAGLKVGVPRGAMQDLILTPLVASAVRHPHGYWTDVADHMWATTDTSRTISMIVRSVRGGRAGSPTVRSHSE